MTGAGSWLVAASPSWRTCPGSSGTTPQSGTPSESFWGKWTKALWPKSVRCPRWPYVHANFLSGWMVVTLYQSVPLPPREVLKCVCGVCEVWVCVPPCSDHLSLCSLRSEYDFLYSEQFVLCQRLHCQVPRVWSLVQEAQEGQRWGFSVSLSLESTVSLHLHFMTEVLRTAVNLN